MSSTTHNALVATHALLPTGWARDVLLAWDDSGELVDVRAGAAGQALDANLPREQGAVIPGMPNLHSHAFQRAFAGLTEFRGADADDKTDSFWSWRTLMYRFASALGPDALEVIATQLYIEMLQAGYTSVCEFHYLHHMPDGRPYDDAAEMSLRLLAAARRVGIGITLLPVLYQDSGFGAKPPRADQRRFVNPVDALLRIVEAAQVHASDSNSADRSPRRTSPRTAPPLSMAARGPGRSAPTSTPFAPASPAEGGTSSR